mmetsp:Transcript_12181/g.29780  ORF Transcript_12181/g.29780 Transcript_12181/m.29780 type:complete len:283 (+) Transcript_12181:78-926(+)
MDGLAAPGAETHAFHHVTNLGSAAVNRRLFPYRSCESDSDGMSSGLGAPMSLASKGVLRMYSGSSYSVNIPQWLAEGCRSTSGSLPRRVSKEDPAKLASPNTASFSSANQPDATQRSTSGAPVSCTTTPPLGHVPWFQCADRLQQDIEVVREDWTSGTSPSVGSTSASRSHSSSRTAPDGSRVRPTTCQRRAMAGPGDASNSSVALLELLEFVFVTLSLTVTLASSMFSPSCVAHVVPLMCDTSIPLSYTLFPHHLTSFTSCACSRFTDNSANEKFANSASA